MGTTKKYDGKRANARRNRSFELNRTRSNSIFDGIFLDRASDGAMEEYVGILRLKQIWLESVAWCADHRTAADESSMICPSVWLCGTWQLYESHGHTVLNTHMESGNNHADAHHNPSIMWFNLSCESFVCQTSKQTVHKYTRINAWHSIDYVSTNAGQLLLMISVQTNNRNPDRLLFREFLANYSWSFQRCATFHVCKVTYLVPIQPLTSHKLILCYSKNKNFSRIFAHINWVPVAH